MPAASRPAIDGGLLTPPSTVKPSGKAEGEVRPHCAPQKLICYITDRLIQPKLWLTHQEPITIGNGTCGGRKDRVDVSGADGAYEGEAMDGSIGIHL